MKYDVILADPPWRYSKTVGQGIAEDVYPTMGIDELCALPVGDFASDNCVLFLWTTAPTLLDYAPKIIKAWGFEYKTKAFCWVKANKSGAGFFFGIGHYTASNTEDCLLCTKGKPVRVAKDVSQIIYAPLTRHSQKPPEQYSKIERLYPDKMYLELFARNKNRPGWDYWGNEIESDIAMGERI